MKDMPGLSTQTAHVWRQVVVKHPAVFIGKSRKASENSVKKIKKAVKSLHFCIFHSKNSNKICNFAHGLRRV